MKKVRDRGPAVFGVVGEPYESGRGRSRRIRVYVSGPIRLGNRQRNIMNLVKTGQRLMEKGYAPFVPVLSDYMAHLERRRPKQIDQEQRWVDIDLAWVAASDALIRLPGESLGANTEVATARLLSIPIYRSLEYFFKSPPQLGDRRIHAIFHRLAQLHDRKQRDYGTPKDPFANVRGSQDWGIEPWISALSSSNDALRRIQNFHRKRFLVNETVDDSLDDFIVYGLIAQVLRNELLGRDDVRAQFI